MDGDTFDGMTHVAVWFGFGKRVVYQDFPERVRPLGYDAPERGEPGYAEATAKALEIAPVGSLVLLSSEGRDFNGRILARVTLPDGSLFDERIVAATPFATPKHAQEQLRELLAH